MRHAALACPRAAASRTCQPASMCLYDTSVQRPCRIVRGPSTELVHPAVVHSSALPSLPDAVHACCATGSTWMQAAVPVPLSSQAVHKWICRPGCAEAQVRRTWGRWRSCCRPASRRDWRRYGWRSRHPASRQTRRWLHAKMPCHVGMVHAAAVPLLHAGRHRTLRRMLPQITLHSARKEAARCPSPAHTVHRTSCL